MKLKSITIENYRSIEKQVFLVSEIAGSYTYGLIGVNESGKTSLLKAISLIDEGEVSYPTDFYNEKNLIDIFSTYELEASDVKDLKKELSAKSFPKDLLSEIKLLKLMFLYNLNL